MICFFVFLLQNCNYNKPPQQSSKVNKIPKTYAKQIVMPKTDWDRKIKAAGLLKIKDLDSNIIVDLKYSTPDNFMQKDVYGDFADAYLRPEVANKLILAQKNIKNQNQNHTLIVYDAFRPRSVQLTMWEIVKNTPQANYVANPYKGKGSLHNLGVAVDLSIWDTKTAQVLDMGTPYDFLGALAEPQLEQFYLKNGKLSAAQIANRHILKKAMTAAGFSPLDREWWHFDGFERSIAEKKYDFLEL